MALGKPDRKGCLKRFKRAEADQKVTVLDQFALKLLPLLHWNTPKTAAL